jgi:hypothetical protein
MIRYLPIDIGIEGVVCHAGRVREGRFLRRRKE